MNLINCFALAANPNGTYPAFSAEAWKYAGEMTLLGMGMIFSVLAILMGVLMIFKLVFAGKTPKTPKEKKPEKKDQSVSVETVPDDTISAVIAAGIQAYQEDSNEALVAVITAAVAAYRASEGLDADGFRVVSFKRVGGRHWNSRK